MTIRLFDGHPEIHVHPIPMTVRWPLRGTEKNVSKIGENFSLVRWAGTGWKKQASNADQTNIPIVFDQEKYHSIFRRYLPDDPSPSSARARFDSACTARFNAWQNYRYLGGAKKYQMLHSTIWNHTPTEKVVDHFFRVYPEGFMLFVARKPEDWLVSLKGLESESNKPAWLNSIDDYLTEYVDSYGDYLAARNADRIDRMLVLEFDRLITDSKHELSKVCEAVGISYDNILETTTTNGIPVKPNSTHKIEGKSAPDKSVIGRGAQLAEELRDHPKFKEACRQYEKVISLAG